jgi:hypothetical protein
METINYSELARRVGDMVLMNNITSVDENLFENVENGNLYDEEYPDDHIEIYQYYAITSGGADYLKSNTNEIVLYSDILDTYFWGITHFGTPWEGVETTLK